MRIVGARALSEIGDHRAYDALLSLLRSDNEQVVAGAAAGLGDLGDPAALAAIRERIDARPSSRVRSHCCSAVSATA
jgi:HEAT repeat protein